MSSPNPGSPGLQPSAPKYRRVIVRGTSGAGKTTFSRAVGEKLKIEVTEIDSYQHLPGWTERPHEELCELMAEVVEKDSWVIDGNYQKVMGPHQHKADLIVWLDYSFLTVFGRLFYRTMRRMITREELWSGNRETFFKQFFTRDSILWWMITTHKRRRDQCAEQEREFADSDVEFVRFRKPRDAESWLRNL